MMLSALFDTVIGASVIALLSLTAYKEATSATRLFRIADMHLTKFYATQDCSPSQRSGYGVSLLVCKDSSRKVIAHE